MIYLFERIQHLFASKLKFFSFFQPSCCCKMQWKQFDIFCLISNVKHDRRAVWHNGISKTSCSLMFLCIQSFHMCTRNSHDVAENIVYSICVSLCVSAITLNTHWHTCLEQMQCIVCIQIYSCTWHESTAKCQRRQKLGIMQQKTRDNPKQQNETTNSLLLPIFFFTTCRCHRHRQLATNYYFVTHKMHSSFTMQIRQSIACYARCLRYM